jgi:uncharacterized membrane-anchored protein
MDLTFADLVIFNYGWHGIHLNLSVGQLLWCATDVILINVPQDILIYDVPILKAIAGAVIFEVLWYLIAYRSYRLWSRRRRLYAQATPTQEQ